MSESQDEGARLLLYLVPFGSLDMACAARVLKEADITYRDFGDYVDEFMADTEIRFFDLDLVYLCYEYILQNVRCEIEQATGIDICNDTEIYTFGNFGCTIYDRCDAAHEAALEIEEDERSDMLNWFIDNTH